MQVTRRLIEASPNCKYKAYLLASGRTGTPPILKLSRPRFKSATWSGPPLFCSAMPTGPTSTSDRLAGLAMGATCCCMEARIGFYGFLVRPRFRSASICGMASGRSLGLGQ
jgi:hypothetical protein